MSDFAPKSDIRLFIGFVPAGSQKHRISLKCEKSSIRHTLGATWAHFGCHMADYRYHLAHSGCHEALWMPIRTLWVPIGVLRGGNRGRRGGHVTQRASASLPGACCLLNGAHPRRGGGRNPEPWNIYIYIYIERERERERGRERG